MINFKPYIQEFKALSYEEKFNYLVKYWKIEDCVKHDFCLQLVGQYQKADHKDKNGNDFGYFINIRNLNGDILYYPFGLGEVKLWAPHKQVFDSSEFWMINITLDRGKFAELNPCQLKLYNHIFGHPKNKFKDKIEKEKLIKKIFLETGYTERDAKNEANSLRSIMGDLYTETERFIFELLQNADDQPNLSSKVKASLMLIEGNLLFIHNGKPFDSSDVESICSIGDSTKKNDSDKIGYKGIGFKSVFSDSETVFINSGNFSFSFDKESWYYKDVKNIEEVPWQIKPIWAEKYRYPKPVQGIDTFFNSPVSIALSITDNKVYEYSHIIPQLLEEPRFVLFLRNISLLKYEDLYGKTITIQKTIEDKSCVISLNDNTNSSWITEDFVLNVPDETQQLIQDDKLVPKKLKEVTKSRVSFAAPFNGDKISKVEKEKSILFTYLPTKVSDFQFPFIVNGDFLTTASRESIHFKNHWNIFLFEGIGSSIVDWAIILSSQVSNYIEILPSHFLPTGDETRKLLSEAFNESYQLALEEKAFILDSDGNLSKQESIIIDKTGISEVLDHTTFYKIFGGEKRLPHPNIAEKIRSFSNILNKVGYLEDEHLNEALIQNRHIIQNWIENANEESLAKFYEWIKKALEKNLLDGYFQFLPIYKYNNSWYSTLDTRNDKSIVPTTQKILSIKDVLVKLGFKCTDDVADEHPLFDYMELPKDIDLYKDISEKDFSTLSFDERKSLFFGLDNFEGVGEEKRKSLKLFMNHHHKLSPLSQLIPNLSKLGFPTFKGYYMLDAKESIPEIEAYCVKKEDEYSSIVVPNIDTILCNPPSNHLWWVYFNYKDYWTNEFTQSLCTKESIEAEELLRVIEDSDAGTVTKKAYITQHPTIKTSVNIDTSVTYKDQDFIYRYIQLVSSDVELIKLARNKILIDGNPLTDFTIKDSFSITIGDVVCQFKLSDILPSYQSSSKLASVIENFSSIPNQEKLFELKEIDNTEWIKRNLLEYLSTEENAHITACQFAFFICYEKKRGKHYFEQDILPHIKIDSEDFFVEILQYCYEKNLGSILRHYYDQNNVKYPYTILYDTYFDCGIYALETEETPKFIINWADTEDKKKFLISLGLHNKDCDEIKRRIAFYNNEDKDSIWSVSSTNVIRGFLEWVEKRMSLPFTDKFHTEILIPLLAKLRRGKEYSETALTTAVEWNDDRYNDWKNDKDLRIFVYDGQIPYSCSLDEVVFYCGAEKDFHYFSDTKHLYINGQVDAASVLSNVYPIRGIFEKDDWHQLFFVSRDSITKYSDENETLRNKVAELEDIINQYRAAEHTGKEVTEKGKVGSNDQEAINREVRIMAKPILRDNNYDVSGWDPVTSPPDIIGIIKTPEGEPINVIVRSAKGRKIHLAATSFESLMSNPKNLLIVRGEDGEIHTVDFQELFGGNSNVNLIFDANFTPLSYFQALGTIFKYVKNTDFVIENPHYSAFDEIKGFGLDIKNEGVIILGAEEDI